MICYKKVSTVATCDKNSFRGLNIPPEMVTSLITLIIISINKNFFLGKKTQYKKRNYI